MTAILRLGDSLKVMLGKAGEYTIEPGGSVRDALVSLGIKPELVAMVTVAGELQTKDYLIQEGDVVKVLAVIGGG